jgi:hypothetical protein
MPLSAFQAALLRKADKRYKLSIKQGLADPASIHLMLDVDADKAAQILTLVKKGLLELESMEKTTDLPTYSIIIKTVILRELSPEEQAEMALYQI